MESCSDLAEKIFPSIWQVYTVIYYAEAPNKTDKKKSTALTDCTGNYRTT